MKRLPLLVIVALLAFAVGRVTSGASADVPYAFAPVPSTAFAPVVPSATIAPEATTAGISLSRQSWKRAVTADFRARVRIPLPARVASSRVLRGVASWYATGPGGMTAAAGPALRVGDWRGRIVTVCAGACIAVRLVDFCQCYGVRVLDLSAQAFARLTPLDRGVVSVKVSW